MREMLTYISVLRSRVRATVLEVRKVHSSAGVGRVMVGYKGFDRLSVVVVAVRVNQVRVDRIEEPRMPVCATHTAEVRLLSHCVGAERSCAENWCAEQSV